MKHLTEIFEHQRQLMNKFHHIEVSNLPERGFPDYDIPLDLNNMRAQLRLKEFAARITEELVESKSAEDVAKAKEEVIDAFHFLIEFYILIGIDATTLKQADPIPDFFTGDTFTTVMAQLWGLMNTLRYRPWKQKQPDPIHVGQFVQGCLGLWHRFTDIFVELDMTPDEVYAVYIGKNEVNHSRIILGV